MGMGLRPFDLRSGLNRNIQNVAEGAYRGEFAAPQFSSLRLKGGGEVKSLKPEVLPPGPIQGPGTAKSDSIPTKLKVHDFILPAEVVQAIGPDKLQEMVAQFEQEGQAEDAQENGEEIPAKVSNGEFRVPANVVEKTGPEYWDKLVMQVTGHPAQPEISQEGVKAENGYSPDSLSGQRQASQEFWNQPNRSVAPTPGRANPVNPSEVMQSRLGKSATNAATQAQGLRSQINQNVSLKPAPQLPTLPSNVTSAPMNQPQPIKGNMDGMSSEMGIASGLAYDVLTAPEIAKGRDDAIATLKAKGGFSPTATPFKYAEGGLVVKAADGLDPRKLKELINQQTGVGQRTVYKPLSATEAAGQTTPSQAYNEFVSSQKPTLKPSALQQQINQQTGVGQRAGYVPLSGSAAAEQSIPTKPIPRNEFVGPKTVSKEAQAYLGEQGNTLSQQPKPFKPGSYEDFTFNPPGKTNFGGAGAGLLTTGLAAELQQSPRNQAQLEQARQSLQSKFPNAKITGIPGQSSYAPELNGVYDNLQSSIKSLAANTEQGHPQQPSNTQSLAETPKILKNKVANPKQDNATIQQPPKPSLKTAVQPADPTTGFRYDGAPQTLDWNESRFDNSGNAAEDQAINDRRAATSLMRRQQSLSTPETLSKQEVDPRTGRVTDSTYSQGGFKADIPTLGSRNESKADLMRLAIEQEKLNQPEYAAVSQGEGVPPFVYNKRTGQGVQEADLSRDENFLNAMKYLQSGDQNKAQIGKDYLRTRYKDFYTRMFGEQ